MVYKIGLVSTHGTGKTSIAALVEGELKRRSILTKRLDEMSTKVKELGLPINEETTLEAQMCILHLQFAYELRYSAHRPEGPNYEVLLCDRGPDNYCYLKRKFQDNSHALRMTLGHLQEFPYQRIYLLPIVEEQILADGVRSTNPDFQREMDREIRDFLAEYHIKHDELPQPTQEDSWRDQWTKIIVNDTLTALGKNERYMIS